MNIVVIGQEKVDDKLKDYFTQESGFFSFPSRNTKTDDHLLDSAQGLILIYDNTNFDKICITYEKFLTEAKICCNTSRIMILEVKSDNKNTKQEEEFQKKVDFWLLENNIKNFYSIPKNDVGTNKKSIDLFCESIKNLDTISECQLFIAEVFSQKRYEYLYTNLKNQFVEEIGNVISDDIINHIKKSFSYDFEEQNKKFQNQINIIKRSFLGDNDEKSLMFLFIEILNKYLFNDVTENKVKYDFCFDYPLDIFLMVSISDFEKVIFQTMSLLDEQELTNMNEHIISVAKYLSIESNEFRIEKKDFEYLLSNEDIETKCKLFKEEFLMPITIYLRKHIKKWENDFLNNIIKDMTYQDLVEISYSYTPDDDSFFINSCFIMPFIENDSYRSTAIHDIIEFSNKLCEDYHTFGINSDDSRFFDNAFLKLSSYFKTIVAKDYSPFLSSSIYETVYKLKKLLLKGNTRRYFKESMGDILKKTNNIKMNSDQQKKSLPYYFLDLSGTPLHKLMELNPKTMISFSLSPYLLRKDLPNIEVLIKDPAKSDKYQDKFDSSVFSCSPTANSTIAVVRDIFVEYDSVTERLIDNSAPKNNIFKEKQTSPLPGMLIFKLSMLQWDFMPNFAQDMEFVPVFQVPYNSINKYALKKLRVKVENGPTKYYLDLHTADCNLCFYPLNESEKRAIADFFKNQIRIDEYTTSKLKQHFLEKTKGEMAQAASNYIPNMILTINKEKKWPKYPFDEPFNPNEPYETEKSTNGKKNPYEIMFKDFKSSSKNEIDEAQMSKIIEDLCRGGNNSPILLLESVCYLCQKEPKYASIVLDLLEKELKKPKANKELILIIIDRFIDPAILQKFPELVDKAKKLTESLHFIVDKEKTIFDLQELQHKVIDIAKGSQFFSLTSEERKDRLGFDEVHREWLIKSIPNSDDFKDDEM